MGLFSKIKNKMGIGGVKVQLSISAQLPKDVDTTEGKITLTTKSEQEIVDISVKFLEEFTTGRGESAKKKEFELGKVVVPGGFSISPGDSKEIIFTLPFNTRKSNAESLADKGGALGALGKLGKMANNESSRYYIIADVDVKSAVLDPSDKKEISFS